MLWESTERAGRSRKGLAWTPFIRGDNAIAWRFVKLAATADLVQALHKQSVPVAPPLASVDGQHRVIIGSLSVTVQPQIIRRTA